MKSTRVMTSVIQRLEKSRGVVIATARYFLDKNFREVAT